MSPRKRPLSEAAQPYLATTRHAPSTPHAIRAHQQRSGVKSRSARTLRHAESDPVRPDSIRGVLRQLAKISAPITRKRVVTPSSIQVGKENQKLDSLQEDDNDSALLKRPRLTLAIEESIDDDDSELPVAPTPSVLPEDDEDYDQPTVTFQNLRRVGDGTTSEKIFKRKSRISSTFSDSVLEVEQEDQGGDFTLMTERGRRAISEEATGRLSRFSFGSIRMSDFGSELEIRRESGRHKTVTGIEYDDYVPIAAADDPPSDNRADETGILQDSPGTGFADDTIQMSKLDDETFRLDLPVDQDEITRTNFQRALTGGEGVVHADSMPARNGVEDREAGDIPDTPKEVETSRRQTLLETATTKASISRRKRVKLTRHGTVVPSLPTSLIKRVVLQSYEEQGKRKPKLGRDHIQALEQATEWFFEQAGEDLAAYSSHGRRKKRITSDDVLLLMSRQRLMHEEGDLKELARTWLPKETLQDLDLPDVV